MSGKNYSVKFDRKATALCGLAPLVRAVLLACGGGSDGATTPLFSRIGSILQQIGVKATKLVGATSIVVLAACGGGGDQVAATTPVTPVTAPVTPVNHVPTFASANTSSSVTLMSQPAIISLPYATDADSGDTLTYTVSNLPTGITYDPTTHSISISPTTTPNTYTLSIVATDKSRASATMTVSLEVLFVPPVLPATLPDISVGDNGGINPVIFTINMPVLLDMNGNQIQYQVADGLPTIDANGPVIWTKSQTGATINISGIYSGFGGIASSTIHTTSPQATGSTAINLNIQTY